MPNDKRLQTTNWHNKKEITAFPRINHVRIKGVNQLVENVNAFNFVMYQMTYLKQEGYRE
jgi:hypothetical protein